MSLMNLAEVTDLIRRLECRLGPESLYAL